MGKADNSTTVGARVEYTVLANLYLFYTEIGSPCDTQGKLVRRALEDFCSIIRTTITPVESSIDAAAILCNAFHTKTDPKILASLYQQEVTSNPA